MVICLVCCRCVCLCSNAVVVLGFILLVVLLRGFHTDQRLQLNLELRLKGLPQVPCCGQRDDLVLLKELR
jgi:hypothetical protein